MKIALGTVQFGLPYGVANKNGQVSPSAVKAMLKSARESEIDTLDTAIAYGDSEARLGEIGTQGFKLVTKLPPVPDSCTNVNDWVQKHVKESFARLGVSSIYALLLHSSLQLLGKDGKILYQALLKLKDTGQVQKIGISIYSPRELDELLPIYNFDLVQGPLNLIDCRLFTSGWLQRLKDKGVEIHTRSAFLQGLLLMPYKNIPSKFSPWAEIWLKWNQWITAQNVSAISASLSFPLAFPEVDNVVVGADSLIQLEQIIEAANTVFPENLPDLSCDDDNLINPSRWSAL